MDLSSNARNYIPIVSLAAVALAGALTRNGWLIGISVVATGLVMGGVVYTRWRKHKRSLNPDEIVAPASADSSATSPARRPAHGDLRRRLRKAVTTMRDSRLGDSRGRSAQNALPWCMLIGHPAAGKSAIIANAGLRLPLADDDIRPTRRMGETEDCDWIFTPEGILLDTAGRYSRSGDDPIPWRRFLGLLKRHRPRAPINGVIVVASIRHLVGQAQEGTPPNALERHAVDLRGRLHDIAEHLQVAAPVYVVFTMADQIAGFHEFFGDLDVGERNKLWGATLPFDAEATSDPSERFSRSFDTLHTALRARARRQMCAAATAIPGPLLTLPLEVAALKPLLTRFIATLFQDNPFQSRPVFRGFYFTSAEQHDTAPSHLVESIASRFAIRPGASATRSSQASDAPLMDGPTTGREMGDGYFLHDMFRHVIFPDAGLVRQISTRRHRRSRFAKAAVACLLTGFFLAWLAHAYRTNQQLIRNVQADFAEAKRLQTDRVDLKSRFDALMILQDRLQQLLAYRKHHPYAFGPLYTGDKLLASVRREYFAGMRQLMTDPVSARMESYLENVVTTPASDKRAKGAGRENPGDGSSLPSSPYQASSASSTSDAYGALKAYLMLADPTRAESAHLATQLTRFWRQWLEEHRGAMSREDMVERAERLLSLHVTLAGEPDWPTIQPRAALVDDARRVLAEALQGTPARDRVYAEIVARASARYPAVTVREIIGAGSEHTLTGSYAIPGAYSVAAWEGYVRQAIGDASRKALDTSDWVLQDNHVADLTLSGSPEHIRKDLQSLYAGRYIDEWQAFLAGVSMADMADFGRVVAAMERLGDTDESPLKKLLERARVETSWDRAQDGAPTGPSDAARDAGQRGAMPALPTKSQPSGGHVDGPVARTFAGLARIVDPRDGVDAPLVGYLAALGRLRTRLHGIENEGDVGPGARRLVEATMQGKASELADALRITDDHMLTGLADSQRRSLRPLLLRPLMQTFAALVPHVEQELNRVWTAQVYQPFSADLARKFPFDEGGRIEATPEETAALFGPTGAIARFASETLSPLVERRGDILTPRQWGERGITLSPALLTDFPQWVAPAGSTVSGPQTLFQLMPEPTPSGVAEYTVTIGTQSVRYRNEPPQWSNFSWGGTSSMPLVVIEATTTDGRIVRVADYQGGDALGELVRAARRQRADDGTHMLAWSKDDVAIGMRLKIVSTTQVDADGVQKRGLRGVQLPDVIAGGASASATKESAL